eukprot:Plantae.Rhodophyta-Hildenbrandia_rubra.ctg8167.p1 GENE.Plantae.Rhodophyta-Hildenbrandia_rubra.ctg8167~~Plantae.Rhodophyta-Hildenbrandia_rubra.ctg8167.p1  ORF type:complete len:742 (+),score=169.31 Plantae.Rhodophyta-Hildenbrandia_rubra.ctg8167:2053-4278(+)
MALSTATIGYPRIGRGRELKFALESFWSKKGTLSEVEKVSSSVHKEGLKSQADANITYIGVGDHSMYDPLLDVTYALGLIPKRFTTLDSWDKKYFAMARGTEGAQALDMSKWFDTNYHYLKPEISKGDKVDNVNWSRYLDVVKEGISVVGKDKAVPIVVGPVTYARLATRDGVSVEDVVKVVMPGYEMLMEEFKKLEVCLVQIHEPALCLGDVKELKNVYEFAFKGLSKAGIPLNLVSYYDDIGDTYSWAVKLQGVETISLDFTRGDNLSLIKKHGFPQGKCLGAGVIDGRSVWDDEKTANNLIAEIKQAVGSDVKIVVQPSSSLQHVPVDLELEKDLPADVKNRLAFAVQKLSLLSSLAGGKASNGISGDKKLANAAEESIGSTIKEEMFSRKEKFADRRQKQFTVEEGFGTTTIGSFPQTKEIRRLRAQKKAGKISEEEYNAKIDAQIAYNIGVQEALGLDVFVDGEPYRSDMSEFFGIQMEGFAFTRYGWVQSYGSRYVRPPIIHGDVSRPKPMTTREFSVAQSYTDKPVKGMLTGPVTILNWSFPRKDISRKEQAYQIGLAIRKETIDLEAAGCKIIQVDEPALREGLPLKEGNWASYLDWAVKAFRLATSGVKPETQIVTHLCYSDFDDIMKAIDDLDADVLTIENSRSGDEMLRALSEAGYSKDVGPGCYDIHSAVVPTLKGIQTKVKMFDALKLDKKNVWVNPDCGLKTRKWVEVIPALTNMVTAAKEARKAHA